MKPIPVTVLTGFLGSGKTTLLNRIFATKERLLASAGEEGDVLLWSPSQGLKPVGLAPMQAEVTALCFSPDDAWLAAADAGGRVRVWSPAKP